MNQNYTGHIRKGLITRLLLVLFLGLFTVAQAEPPAKLIEFWDDHEADSRIKMKHAPWQEILDQYLNDQHPSGINRFDYERVSEADHLKLRDYLDYLQRMEPRQLNKNEAQAYWINFYNAKIVELVVDALKSQNIDSIRELRSGMFAAGPWKRKVATVVQQEMSLDDIQHGVLRPIWQDHRIHFVLTKASLGCANLQKTAFTGENVEELLANAEREYLSHRRAVRLDDGDLVLSSVFDWYADDFASNKAAFFEYLRNNVPTEMAATLNAADKTRFEYDWDLNKPSDG